MDILGLLQQVPETSEIKEIKSILLNKLNDNKLNEYNLLDKEYITDEFMNSLTMEKLYELSRGCVSYSSAINTFFKAYELAKSRLRKEKSLNLLEYILNDSKYKDTIDYLRDNTYGVEADIINRKSSKDSINISESVNL